MLLNIQLCYILATLIYVFLPFNLINYQSNILSQIMDRYKMSEMYFGNKDTTINRTIIIIHLFIRFVPFYVCIFGRKEGYISQMCIIQEEGDLRQSIQNINLKPTVYKQRVLYVPMLLELGDLWS